MEYGIALRGLALMLVVAALGGCAGRSTRAAAEQGGRARDEAARSAYERK